VKIRQALKIGEKTFNGWQYRYRTSNAALKRMTRWQRKWRRKRGILQPFWSRAVIAGFVFDSVAF
jgi:hypothetical protein